MIPDTERSYRIGLISDTHRLLRPEALAALRGCDHIVHAGDVGDPAVLAGLAALAPVTAVRGNNDRGEWASSLPPTAVVELGGVSIYMIHDLAELDIDPGERRIQAVVFGHSHQPSIATRNGVLFVNPGSAGPRRFKLPVSAGELQIRDGRVTASLRTLVY